MGVEAIVERRREEQGALLARAREWVESLDLDVQAAAVFGSVPRGDFNQWSDVDVLVVSAAVSGGPLERAAQIGARPPRVQPVVWTPAEARQGVASGNPIALEAMAHGIWLIGSADRAFGSGSAVSR